MAMHLLGHALFESGRREAALEVLKQVASTWPASQRSSRQWVQVSSKLADVLLALGRDEEALHWYGESVASGVLEAWPHALVEVRCGEAVALSRLGRIEEALGILDRAAALSRELNLRVESGQVMRAQAAVARVHELPVPPGSTAPSAAIHYLEALVEFQSGMGDVDPQFLAQLSREYEKTGDVTRALECERRASGSAQRPTAKRPPTWLPCCRCGSSHRARQGGGRAPQGAGRGRVAAGRSRVAPRGS